MQFDSFLTRADDQTLQELLGQRVLRLLRAIDREGFSPRRQRQLLLEQTKPQILLSQPRSRRMLLDLLRPSEAGQLLQVLGIRSSDTYETLRTLTFSGAKFDALLEFFELSPLHVERPQPAPDIVWVRPSYGLFSHQELAARRCLSALQKDPHRVLLHMPTGAGKTRTAMHIISQFMLANPGRAVIWLAHSEELCEQAAEEFERAWSFLGAREVPIHRFWGSHSPDLNKVAGSFVVAGLAKAYGVVGRDMGLISRIGAQAGLVVMDEAHQAIAPTYCLILDALVQPFPGVSLLGLSATPGRTWNDPDSDRKLSEFFKRSKVTLQVEGYDNPVSYLVAEGYLAQAVFRPLKMSGDVELNDAERKRIEEEFEIPKEVMERLALDEVRNLAILTEIEHLVKRHERVIVFATTVEHSDLLAYALRARGIWARSVTGATATVDRQAALEQYKSDASEPHVLCNYGVLTTGFDAPRTSAAVIARPTTSLVLYSQMVGRATRGPRAGGNAEAEIITVLDSGLPGFGDVGEAFLNWEDVWGNK
jgi:DNA repair protein RadD